jgi:glycosyltransferase involved in cell wall biosynthesis
MSRTAVCTIVSKNYLAFARTLMGSLAQHHPEWERVVLLVDELDDSFAPERENFEVLPLAALALPEPRKFTFRYSILELNTAVKPWLMETLFERGCERVVYLDPDIFAHAPLSAVEEAFSRGDTAIVTPHLTEPLRDDKHPSDVDILRAGTYNLGFLALADHPQTRAFLAWWRSKNEFNCVVDIAAGLFVDQKWVDMLPGFIDGAHVLRDPGYNVAYWNLAHRPVELEPTGSPRVAGKPLVFFHWSGFDPLHPGPFSKHQDRFTLRTVGDAGILARAYAERLIGNGHEEVREWCYAWGRLHCGVEIPDAARALYRRSAKVQRDAGDDPFALAPDYFNEPAFSPRGGVLISRLMLSLWHTMPDLQQHYPDIVGADRLAYATIFVSVLAPTLKIPDAYTAPVATSLAGSAVGLRSRGLALAARIARPLARRLAPETKTRIRTLVRRALPRSPGRGGSAVSARLDLTNTTEAFGVNVIGYFSHTSGVSESARRCLAALDAVGIPSTSIDCSPELRAEPRIPLDPDATLFPINVIHVNADHTRLVAERLGDPVLAGRYNIAVWHWELPEFPKEWRDRFDVLDEIWAPSRFVQDTVSAVAPIPVVYMPHAIAFEPPQASRADFALPEDRFVFLAMLDLDSVAERKNPAGAVEAFRTAFPDGEGAVLALKVHHSERHAEDRQALDRLMDVPGVHLIDRTLSRDETYGLENICDAFVSLHRSEGFGLVAAEFMYLGKPVIATHWSGNADFMSAENSCPVRARVVALERDHPPYRRGSHWAVPDVDQAAQYLQRVAKDPEYRARIGREAAQAMREHHDPTVIGRRLEARLQEILRRRDARSLAAREEV